MHSTQDGKERLEGRNFSRSGFQRILGEPEAIAFVNSSFREQKALPLSTYNSLTIPSSEEFWKRMHETTQAFGEINGLLCRTSPIVEQI